MQGEGHGLINARSGGITACPDTARNNGRAADCKKFNKSGSYGAREFIFARVNRIRRVACRWTEEGRGKAGR